MKTKEVIAHLENFDPNEEFTEITLNRIKEIEANLDLLKTIGEMEENLK